MTDIWMKLPRSRAFSEKIISYEKDLIWSWLTQDEHNAILKFEKTAWAALLTSEQVNDIIDDLWIDWVAKDFCLRYQEILKTYT